VLLVELLAVFLVIAEIHQEAQVVKLAMAAVVAVLV
jgi:hypothetical protein